MKKIICCCVFINFIGIAHAETIILKSGKTVHGTVVERTNEHVKLDMGAGVPITYYSEEIDSIKDEAKQPEAQQAVTVKSDLKTFETVYYLGQKEIARSSDGKVTGRIPDGPVKSEIGNQGDVLVAEYKNNQPIEGTIKIYDKDGKIPEGLSLKDGKLNGIYKIYNDKGRIEIFYEDGIDIRNKIYAENAIAGETVYNPKFDETVRKYFSKDGKLSHEIKYKGRTSEKIYDRKYDEAGNLVSNNK